MIKLYYKAEVLQGGEAMKRQIAVFLTLGQSREIREMLARKGFVIYKENFLTREILLIEESDNILYLDNDDRHSGFVCLYNGDLGLEEMGIDRLKLEKSAAVQMIKEQLDNRRAPSAP